MSKRQKKKLQFNSTILIQEIVNILKQPPFSKNLKLMSLNENRIYSNEKVKRNNLCLVNFP